MFLGIFYDTTPIGDWNPDHWKEFYGYLDGLLTLSILKWDDLGIASNQRGGFLDFYWCRHVLKNNNHLFNDNFVYLQIHGGQGHLTFRVEMQELPWPNDRRECISIRDKCSTIIKENAIEKGRFEIIAPPSRPRVGKTMAFARVEREDWLGKSDEIIDMVRVVETLKIYENILVECFAKQ